MGDGTHHASFLNPCMQDPLPKCGSNVALMLFLSILDTHQVCMYLMIFADTYPVHDWSSTTLAKCGYIHAQDS